MRLVFAVLASLFAALTSILAKMGIDGMNSNLPRQFAQLSYCLCHGKWFSSPTHKKGIMQISQKSWIFLILSGIATGASWLCYYKALQTGNVSKVVSIDKLSIVITLILAFVFLHEQLTLKSVI